MRALLLIALTACKPDLDDRESRVDAPRILAIVAEPPEAKPNEPVTYTAVVATAEGPALAPAIQWAYCMTPKPLGENGAVSPECVRDGSPISVGPTAIAPTLPDACARFGPDRPPGDFRPRDPDSTGGYYQPVRAAWAGITAFARERITCNLANAPADVALEFNARYVPNRNPRIAALTARVAGAVVPLDRLPAGREVELTLGWDETETYVVYDPITRNVATRREAMRVSWYATAGSFETDRTGRTQAELDTFTNNVWSHPEKAGPIHLWVVLRDERGGSTHAVYTLLIDGTP